MAMNTQSQMKEPRIARHAATASLVVAFACLLAHPSDAAVFADFDATRHSRFDGSSPNPDFILDENELTGIGGRAALITPRHIVTAAHVGFNATTGFQATFRGGDGNDHSFSTSTFTDVTTTFFDTDTMTTVTRPSDIRIFTLAADVDPNFMISPIGIVDGDTDLLFGREFFVMGISDRAGKNTIDDVGRTSFASGSRPTVVIQFDHDTVTNSGTDAVPLDEASLEDGDSGRQALLRVGDDLALIGAHFGVEANVPTNNSSNYQNFSSLLTPYLDQIDTIVGATGHSVNRVTITAVPEPSTVTAIAGLAVFAWLRRRKR